MRKYSENGTILNRNKEIQIGQRFKEQKTTSNECFSWLRKTLTAWSVRRNGTELSQSSFYRILKNETKAHGPWSLQDSDQAPVAWTRFCTEDDILYLVAIDHSLRLARLLWPEWPPDWRGCLQHEWTCENPKHKTLIRSSSKWKYFWDMYPWR